MESLTIGKLARLAEVGVETIRFHERKRLLDEPPGRECGYRQYSEDSVRRLRFLKEKKGVKLYANRTMMLLYEIGDQKIEPAVTPIGLEEMVKLYETADVYVAY